MKKLVCAAAIALVSLGFVSCSDDDEVKVDTVLITNFCTTYHTCLGANNKEEAIDMCIQAEVGSVKNNGKCQARIEEYHRVISGMECDEINADLVKEKACKELNDDQKVKTCMIRDTKYGKAMYDYQDCANKY